MRSRTQSKWKSQFPTCLVSTHFQLVFASAVTLAVSAASLAGEKIAWRTGVMATTPKTQADIASALQEIAQLPDARHFVVQFDAPLDKTSRIDLQSAGIELLSCLGNDAFFASIDPGRFDAKNVARVGGLVGARRIETTWKLAPQILAGQVPEWAVVAEEPQKGRTVAVYVLFHRDVPLHPDAADIVARYGGTIRDVLESINGLVVELPCSNMEAFGGEDLVQWVEWPLPRMSEVNDSNRAATGADIVQDYPYNLDGSGVTVLVYDGGTAMSSHVDFGGRLSVGDFSGTNSHPTHVACTIGGSGAALFGRYRGMAPGVTMLSYGYEYDGSGIFLYTNPGDIEADYNVAINTHGADISNNSIGTNTCWNRFPCTITGDYGITSALIDSIVRGGLGSPFRVVWSNGNERSCPNCPDEHQDGYHSTAPPAGAKNHISVGAVNSNDDSMTYFSSWGPVDDGRIKPDVCAPGCQSDWDGGVTSCGTDSPYSYYSGCGTSMSGPTVAGLGALLLEDFRAHNPDDPDFRNSTLKVLLTHNAKDLEETGPDYKSGYGLVQIQPAIELMRGQHVTEDQVSQGQTVTTTLRILPGETTALKVTLAWDDVPGTPNVNPALVNDLDLRVYAPDDTRRYPWTLNPSSPSTPAVRTQPDHVNNIEQVFVESPAAEGLWRIEVYGHAVPDGPQPYSICASPRLPQDCNGNGTPDGDEILADPSLDCGGNFILDECEPDCQPNGEADSCDLFMGTSTDCDENGIPDECEDLDCNDNGEYDPCEIMDGHASDCNENSIPDDCDITSGFSDDCLPNDIPDECDLDPTDPDGNGEVSGDCNRNRIPDECDIAGGASLDEDEDGVPDECGPLPCELDDHWLQLTAYECPPAECPPENPACRCRYVENVYCIDNPAGTREDPYCTIGEAYNSAEPGDHIVVTDGTYTGFKVCIDDSETYQPCPDPDDPLACPDGYCAKGPGSYVWRKNVHIPVNKNVVIRSENGPHACRIDVERDEKAFVLGSGSPVIQGFTIVNGEPAIRVQGNHEPVIRGNILEWNFQSAIYSTSDSPPSIVGNLVRDNSSSINGGGIRLSGPAYLEGNGIARNSTSGDGGGIWFGPDAPVTLIGNVLGRNSAGGSGGGLYATESAPVIIDCEVMLNEAVFSGGGVYIYGLPAGSTATVLNAKIWGNIAGNSGGGIFAQGIPNKRIDPRKMDITNSLFVGNQSLIEQSAQDTGGGALYLAYGIEATIINCTMVDNCAVNKGGAIGAVTNDIVEVYNTILWRNDAANENDQFLGDTFSFANCIIEGGADGECIWNQPFAPWANDMGRYECPARSLADYHIQPPSLAIDAGNDAAVPPDTFNLDGDGNTAEQIPIDLDGAPRFVDEPTTPNDKCPATAPDIVDIGAYEYHECIEDADCDDGNDCTDDLCVAGFCEYTNSALGEPCGDPDDADCNAADTCDGLGMCQANVKPAGTECRAAAGDCDVAEACDGNGPLCPPDALQPDGFECRAAAGDCDVAEACDGVAATCPADVFQQAGHVCRPTAGICDVQEVCDGNGPFCPADVLRPADFECRDATGFCDVTEVCDGLSPECPPNGVKSAGTPCRPAVGDCDAEEVCNGSSGACPDDEMVPVGTECRAAAGDCDIPEVCDGVAVDCPADQFKAPIVECRPLGGMCDIPEFCPGDSPACPIDVLEPAGTECRAAAGDCDVAEACDGIAPTCPEDALVPVGTECRAAAGDCDVAEICDGVAPACPDDALESAGTECRAALDDCDIAEACDGVTPACPDDVVVEAGTECRPKVSECDLAEYCDGSSPYCPPHGDPAPDGTSCADEFFCNGEETCLSGECQDGSDPCPGEGCDEVHDTCGGLIIFVDGDATGADDGSSWADAYNHLQDALVYAEAAGGRGTQIWVAEGVYKPDQGLSQTPGSREEIFQLISEVEMRGGYAGWSEPDPDARDIAQYRTVLSGDLNDDDLTVGTDENSYRVVNTGGVDSTAVLDGVTITAGNANGESGSPYQAGGGLSNDGGTPTLTKCTFDNNSAILGGGVGNWNAGAITLTNCAFIGNDALVVGGGIFTGADCTLTLINCLFTGNSAGAAYGGALLNDLGDVTVTNSTLVGNSAGWGVGGGLYSSGGSVTLANCILWDNSADGATDEAAQISADVLAIDYTCVQGWTGNLGGIGNIGSDPLFADADGPDDLPGTSDDDLRPQGGSPCNDAGDNGAVPPDVTDLDGDFDTGEPVPIDLDGWPRFVEDVLAPDCPQPGASCGAPPIVDMGAYEFAECRDDTDCDDGNICTDDVCASGVCSYPPSPSGTPCGGTVTDCSGVDMCDGAGTCDPNDHPAGTPCGDPSDTNCDDPDTCDEAGICLDNHMPDGTPCSDGMYCNGEEFCTSGLCDPGTSPCTVDQLCDENNDTCVDTSQQPMPMPGPPCSDSNPCGGNWVDASCIEQICYIPRTRYLSLDPNNPGATVALRVTHPSSQLAWWIDIPLSAPDEPEVSIAYLTDTPVWRVWDEEVVHVTDCQITPELTGYGAPPFYNDFQIQAIDVTGDTGNEEHYSLPLMLLTVPLPDKDWGDVAGHFTGTGWTPPNTVVNMDDVLAAIQKFQNLEYAPHLTRVDVDPEVPNAVLNFTDIFQLVRAFEGHPYPFSAVEDCHAKRLRRGETWIYMPRSTPEFSLVPDLELIEPGALVTVDAYIGSIADLAVYGLAVQVTGGVTGTLDLEDMVIDRQREDYVFGSTNVYDAVDLGGSRLGGCTTGGGVSIQGPAYLGTFQFRASLDASGIFQITARDGVNSYVNASSADAIPYSPGTGTLIGCGIGCIDNGDCDDAGDCTDDSCVDGWCVNAPLQAGSSCDDGLFCTATDECDGNGTCVGTGDPCPRGWLCVETLDTCLPRTDPLIDAIR